MAQDRVYEPCQKVVEIWPTWKLCERPVRVGGDGRCEIHPVKKLWPDGDAAAWHEMEAA